MNTISILVVDDDVDTATNTAEILAQFGCQVDVAYDVISAMELVERNSDEMESLDLKMPSIGDATLCEQIKKMQHELVAFMAPTHAQDDGINQANKNGAWQVMSKPVDIGKILQRVEEASGQPLVLAIDHESEFCDQLWQTLTENGYRVGIAFNAEEAREQLECNKYPVVLLETQLAAQSSASLFSSIRKLENCPATVIVTDYQVDGDPLINAMLQQSPISVCYKPVEVAALLDTIEQLFSLTADSRRSRWINH